MWLLMSFIVDNLNLDLEYALKKYLFKPNLFFLNCSFCHVHF